MQHLTYDSTPNNKNSIQPTRVRMKERIVAQIKVEIDNTSRAQLKKNMLRTNHKLINIKYYKLQANQEINKSMSARR